MDEDVKIGVEMEAYNTHGELIKFKLRKSESKYIGHIYRANSGEEFKVLGNLDKRYNSQTRGYPYFLIEFEDKTRLIIMKSKINYRNIKNPNAPSVCGVGFIGHGKFRSRKNSKITKVYLTWRGILVRCYDPKYHEKYPTYIGCTVDPRWHNFQNFCEDIQHLEGYEEWKNNTKSRAWALDKDIKIEGNKVYSKDTCMFVTAIENNLKATLTGKTYEATNTETGEVIKFINQTEFAKKYNLDNKLINACIMKKQKIYRGWTFREIILDNTI